MGVIYKLRDEVVRFIISERQGNPLFSCRQLAESASQKFGLNLSKSSVHDVLKESGIVTPRGRKPKDKFQIPQEKKKQIQTSLSQVKLLPAPVEPIPSVIARSEATKQSFYPEKIAASLKNAPRNDTNFTPIDTIKIDDAMEISPEYEGAGKIFLKAALWDLGIFSEENIKETDWNYYLTYARGIKVILENKKSFFIDLPLPLERCIREAADGVINNVRPVIVHKVSDEELFKAGMEAQSGSKIENVSIVDQNDHVISEFSDIVDMNRNYMFNDIVFVESLEKNMLKRSKSIFFPEELDNNAVIENILNLKGFDSKNKYEINLNLIIGDVYEYKIILKEAVEKLNGMYLRDEQGRLVSVILSEAKDLNKINSIRDSSLRSE